MRAAIVALAVALVTSAACRKARAPAARDAPAASTAASDAAAAGPATSGADAGAATSGADGAIAGPDGAAAACIPPAHPVAGKTPVATLRHDRYLLGIDVAHYEGVVDWPAVAASGVSFVYIKATEGTDLTDPCFHHNWQAAGAAGLRRGAYHFFHPGFDPLAQARHFVAVVGTLAPGDLPPAFDLEYAKDLDAVSIPTAIEHARTWLDHVAGAMHRRPLIYSSARVFHEYLRDSEAFDSYAFWLADYRTADRARGQPSLTPGERTWTLWQIEDDAQVPGVAIGTDASWFQGSAAELDAFVAASVLP